MVAGSRAQLVAVVAADSSGIASLALVSCSLVPYQAAVGCQDVGLGLERGLRETRQRTRRRCHFHFRWLVPGRSDMP